MNEFVTHGYVDTFRMYNEEPEQYTYWDQMSRARARNVGWRIDYFFASENLRDRIKGAYIYPQVMGSDHCPSSPALRAKNRKFPGEPREKHRGMRGF